MGLDSETINICYVLDARRELIGTVALRYLLLSRGDERIADIMHENVISIHTLMDQEQVAEHLFVSRQTISNWENELSLT